MSDINELISKEALKSVSDLEATFAKIITTLDALIKKSQSLDTLLSSMNKVADAQDRMKKVSKDVIDTNQKLQKADDEATKAKIRAADAAKAYKKELEYQVRMEKAASDSLVTLKKKLYDLKQEYDNASKSAREKMAPAIKKVNDEISKAEKSIGISSRGVGKYKEGILDAAKSIVGFTGVVGLAVMAVDKLKEAFASTDKGLDFLNKTKAIFKSIGQGIVSGNNIKDIFKNAVLTGSAMDKSAEIRKGERVDLVEIARLEGEIVQLRLKAADATLSAKEQADNLTKAIAKENELIAYQVADKQEELDNVNKLLEANKDDTILLEKKAQLEAEIINIKNSQSVRLYAKEQAAREKSLKGVEDQKKAEENLADKRREQAATAEKENQDFIDSWLEEKKKAADEDWKFQTEISKQLFEQNREQAQKEWEAKEKEREKEKQAEQDMLREKKRLQEEITQSIYDMGSSLIDAKYEKDLSKLNQQKEAELKAAGDSAELKDQINEKYAKKEIALKRKAAMAQKIGGIFSIIIDTAKGVTNAAATVATIPLIPWIIANGAIQAAIVASRPLPQYAKGTRSSGSGAAVVGEKGRELMISPSGQMSLTSDSAEIVNLQRGTQIIPSDETKRILAASMAMKNNGNDAVQERRHKELLNTIKNKKELILRVGVGSKITERDGLRFKEYFGRHLS